MKHESCRSVFDWDTGEPSVFAAGLQKSSRSRQASAARIEEQRAAGKDHSIIHGLSARADKLLATRQYSPLIEGAAAGQKSADRRDAIRRGGR